MILKHAVGENTSENTSSSSSLSSSYGPCIAALHVWVALIVPGCGHVCLHLVVDVGSSSVCMCHVLILMSILVLNCEVL